MEQFLKQLFYEDVVHFMCRKTSYSVVTEVNGIKSLQNLRKYKNLAAKLMA